MAQPWYQDQEEVVAFSKILNECEEFEDIEAVIYFIEHPRKWNQEYEKWTELDQPVDEDDDGWDDFVTYLDGR